MKMYLEKIKTRNAALAIIALVFLALGFAPTTQSAQTKNAAKKTPTPAKKKTTPTPAKSTKPATKATPKATPKTSKTTTKATPKPATKATPKPTPKPAAKATPKPTPKKPAVKPTATPAKSTSVASNGQIIVTAASARLRSKPSTSSSELRRVKLGSILKLIGTDSSGWYKTEVTASPKNVVGWMSSQVASEYNAADSEEIYRRVVERNYKENMSFSDAAELFDFLGRVQNESKSAKNAPDFAFKRLLALKSALKAIPFGKGDSKPYSDFVKANDKSVIYSEPSGEWYVRSELFWDVRKKYENSPLAEEIARAGAMNPLGGECEGYLNCYLYIMRETDAKYLEFYPNGKYSSDSIKNIQSMLEPILADVKDKQVYVGPSDASDKAEFYRLISEIRNVVSRYTLVEPEKQRLTQQLNALADGYK